MKIDQQTLKDLELFDTAQGKSIFSQIDKTRTEGGKAFLKKLFKNPRNNISEINRLQDVLKFILEAISTWELKVTEENIKVITKYINSSLLAVSNSNKFMIGFEGYLYKSKYPEYFKEFEAGVTKTINFIKQVNNFYKVNECEIIPEILKLVFEKLKNILKDNKIEALTESEPDTFSLVDIFYYDKLIREKLVLKIESLMELVYEIDAYISMAKAIKQYKLVFPEFIYSDKPYFKADSLFHIFVNQPVRNDLKFNSAKNFLFLTGPNMAGKTTFLKACAVAVYLAHIGMAVPANEMRLSIFSGIFTSINTIDNLNAGYSYYYSEVKRVKEAALGLQSKEKLFVIFDELFKGTNVEDAYECSKLVISGFSKWENGLFILSSHLVELEKDISKFSNIFFNYFASEIEDKKPKYNYLLKQGVSKQRLGRLILENEDILEILGI
jgi:DNA mismatch repair protein MutS